MPASPFDSWVSIPGEEERVFRYNEYLEKYKEKKFRYDILQSVAKLIDMKNNGVSKKDIEEFIGEEPLSPSEYNKQVIKQIIIEHPEYKKFAECYPNEYAECQEILKKSIESI